MALLRKSRFGLSQSKEARAFSSRTMASALIPNITTAFLACFSAFTVMKRPIPEQAWGWPLSKREWNGWAGARPWRRPTAQGHVFQWTSANRYRNEQAGHNIARRRQRR